METNEIRKNIDLYLISKYIIKPINEIESVEARKNLLLLFKNNLEKIKNNLFFTSNEILRVVNKFDENIKLSEFYLGTLYRDLHFAFLNIGVQTSYYIQKDENSTITISFLKKAINELKTRILNSANIIELIDEIEVLKNKLTVANTSYNQ